ncbi:hypothetical protein [Haliangium sp.]|uniref:hypothetical protein n=1 Tax=Haliangium sp. TaxID=2663208 RepID=UPI003D0A8B02
MLIPSVATNPAPAMLAGSARTNPARAYLGLLLGLALITGACSGPDGAAPGPEQPGAAASNEEAARKARALAALRERQQTACEAVATPVFECAVADAQRTLSPEEFAELDAESLRVEHHRRFVADCMSSRMSLRQVEVYETCLSQDTACEALLPCLDQARPQSEEATNQRAPAGQAPNEEAPAADAD